MSGWRFIRYGTPLFLLVVGGSLGLKHFQQIRYDYSGAKPLDREELRNMGIKVKDAGEVTLETEFEKIKTIDTEHWENKRGARPWEKDNQLFQEAVERGAKA